MPQWTPERRLLALLNNIDQAVTHLSYLGREAPHTQDSVRRALKLAEGAQQIAGRDIARDLSLPSVRYASVRRVADRFLMASGELTTRREATALLKRLGQSLVRKNPHLKWELERHDMTDAPDLELRLWDPSDEPLYRSELSVSVDPQEGEEWGFYVAGHGQGYSTKLSLSTPLSRLEAEASKLLKKYGI